MLHHLHIKNFTLIDDLTLDLNAGMTVLTGETGAGKSIVIDAIELALGKRITGNIVRHGCDKAEISLSFDVSNIPGARHWLTEHDLDIEQDCLIRRIITADGRSKSFINDTPATLTALSELGELLINIHGQHESQTLLKPDKQLALLDQFGGHTELCAELNTVFKTWQIKKTDYQTLLTSSLDAKDKTEYLTFQLNELNTLAITSEEITNLEQEQKTLAHAEELLSHCQTVLTILNDTDESVNRELSQVIYTLEKIQAIEPRFSSTVEMINTAIIQTQEAAEDIQQYLNSADLDPERLLFVEQRLSKAYELARKHRVEPHALPALHIRLSEELHQHEHYDEHLVELKSAVDALATQYQTLAKKLSAARKKTAAILGQQVTERIQQLGMEKGRLSVELSAKDSSTLHLHGTEKINFLVSANPGQPLQPLNKVASGGELSRISLAIQVIATQRSDTPSLVFDEVDVGIGGATAEIVGNLLRELAVNTQVLCITHLAQVAAKGQHHLQVQKHVVNDHTISTLVPLDNDERIQEIARMAGGLKITAQTLAHAKEMLTT